MSVILAGIPSGVVMPFAGTVIPAGWLLCDGSTFSRSVYAALFNAISTNWGSGDGSTTAHLPDMRGMFLRGRDNSAGRDPDRASRTAANSGGATGDNVGSVQSDAVQGHWHTSQRSASLSFTNSDTQQVALSPSNLAGAATMVKGAVSNGANGTPREASESRPQNANVNYIIKI